VGNIVSGLRIARGFRLPEEIAGEAVGILAKRGAGKTNTGGVLVEEMLDALIQVVVLDPVGVWWGLRASKSGTDVGYPIAVLGGQHGDVPLEATAGALIADVLVETGQSLVLDLSEFTKTEQRRFVAEFATRLYRRKARARSLLHVVLEEADEFAPQRVTAGDAPMVGAISLIVKRGRSRGLGMTFITQRSASLNKDVLDQADVLIVMRTIGPRDRKAIEGWIEHQDAEGMNEVLPSLPMLQTGEAWVWNPQRDLLRRVQVRLRRTFDSSETPGKKGKAEPRAMAEIDFDALGQQIAATRERAKENDPTALKTELRRLRAELAKRPTEVEERIVEKEVVREIEVPVFEFEDRQAIQKVTDALNDLTTRLNGIDNRVMAVAERQRAHQPVKPPPERVPKPAPVERRVPAKANVERENTENGARLNRRAERMVLAVLAQFPQGRTKKQVAIQSGYAQRGGGFNGALSRLRTLGLIEGSDPLQITDEGLAAIEGQWEPVPTGAALLDHWLRQFNRAAERSVLQVVHAAYPEALTKEEIAERAGYEAAGGGFNGALSKNRTLGLVVKEGDGFRASEEFFD
jgi:hypothetical protein